MVSLFDFYEDGRLIVVYGPMFAKKTTSEIEFLKAAQKAGLEPIAFKPAIDDRYTTEPVIVSHDGTQYPAVVISDPNTMLCHVTVNNQAVVIDEAQFFSYRIISTVEKLLENGICVCAGGLPTDFTGMPFGHMPQLIEMAHKRFQLYANCAVCGKEATMTQRLVNGQPARRSEDQILVGGSENYEARCEHCHEVWD